MRGLRYAAVQWDMLAESSVHCNSTSRKLQSCLLFRIFFFLAKTPVTGQGSGETVVEGQPLPAHLFSMLDFSFTFFQKNLLLWNILDL
jgi:hypothetical protein